MHNTKKVIPGALASLAIAACTAPDIGARDDVILLATEKTEIAGGCSIEMTQTYPARISPEARRVSIRDRAKTSNHSSGVWTLPRPSNDPRPVDNGDGTKTLRVFQWGYVPCRDVSLIVEIGACESGQCLPMRLEEKEPPQGVTVALTR